MQLRKARLCLDCEELHDQRRCPVCASGTFAYLTQWMPAPERRKKPRMAFSEREPVTPRAPGRGGVRVAGGVAGAVAGALVLTLVRWRDLAREHLEAVGIRAPGELR